MKYLLGLAVVALFGTLLIPVPQVWNVSLIEAIWTLVGLVTVAFSLRAMPKVVTDYIVAKHATAQTSKIAQTRTLLARGHVRREVIRLAQGMDILLIGVYADIQANPIHEITFLGLVVTLGLVNMAALVGLQTFLDQKQREHAEELLKEEL